MPLTPSANDNEYDLLFKAADNWYNYAVAFGVVGLNPPRYGKDTEDILLKKMVYVSAKFIDTH